MTKSDFKYYTKRVIAAVLIFVVLSLIKSCDVQATSCDPATLNITYNDGNTWYNMNDPLVYSGVDKISYKFQNNNIGNNNVTSTTNITINTSQNITTSDIKIYSDTNGTNNITNNCSISVSGNVPNSNIPQIRSVQLFEKGISIACNYTPNNGNALNVVIELDQATIENENIYGCLKINPNDTEQLLNGMAQNTNNIVEEMNYNANINQNQLNDVENAIQELFPNFGSCRKMGHVILTKNKALDSNGNEIDNNNYGISGMIRVYPTDTLDRMKPSADNVYACFYGNMNQLIECQTERQVINYQIPADAYYVRFTWSQIDDSPETYHCSKDDQMVQNAIDEAADSINKFREEYNKSQQVCEQITNVNEVDGKYFYSSGAYGTNENFFITQYIDIFNSTIKVIARGNAYYSCYYSKTKDLISCTDNAYYQNGDYMVSPTNAYYLRLSVRRSNNTPTIEVCKNGNQGIYQFLSPSSVDSVGVGSSFSNFDQHLANTGVITNLLTLPVSFFTKVLNSLNTQCITFNLGSLLGTNISFPCIDLESYFGVELWSVIDVLLCGFFVYRIGKQIIKVFLNLSSLKEGDVLDG